MAIVPQAVAQLTAQPDQPSSSFLLGIPWYHNVVLIEKIIDAMEVQVDLSSKALNSAEIRERLKGLMLNQLGLYEKLKSRATGA